MEAKFNTTIMRKERDVLYRLLPKVFTIKHQKDWWKIQLADDSVIPLVKLFECYDALRHALNDQIGEYAIQGPGYKYLDFSAKERSLKQKQEEVQKKYQHEQNLEYTESERLKVQYARTKAISQNAKVKRRIVEIQQRLKQIDAEMAQKDLSLNVVVREHHWQMQKINDECAALEKQIKELQAPEI